MHPFIIKEIGNFEYYSKELGSFLIGDERGAAHDWIYDRGEAAGDHYWNNQSTKPDISIEHFRNYIEEQQ